jgi:hypothetical protein
VKTIEDRSGSYTGGEFKDNSSIELFGKYFIHGFVYSLLMVGALVVWIFILLFLLIIGSIIGLAVGFVVIFIIMGWINKSLAGWLWGIEARDAWTSLLGHGFVLFLVLLIVQIPSMLIDAYLAYSTPVVYLTWVVVNFIVYSLIDGFVGKRVASMFQESGTDYRVTPSSVHAPTAPYNTCPVCGVVFPYRDVDIALDGTAACRKCGAILHDPRYEGLAPVRRLQQPVTQPKPDQAHPDTTAPKDDEDRTQSDW